MNDAVMNAAVMNSALTYLASIDATVTNAALMDDNVMNAAVMNATKSSAASKEAAVKNAVVMHAASTTDSAVQSWSFKDSIPVGPFRSQVEAVRSVEQYAVCQITPSAYPEQDHTV